MSTRDAADPERGGNNDVAAYAEVGYSSSGDEFATDAPHPEQGENGEEAVCEELGYSSSTNKSRKIWTGRKKAVVNLRISLTSTPQKDMNPMTMSKVMNDPQSSLEGCQVGEPSVAEGKKRESIQSEVADSNGQKKPSPKYPGKKKVKRLPHPQSSEHSAFKKLIRELGQQLLGLESPKELPRIIGEEEIAAWDPESGLCCTVDNFSVDLKGYACSEWNRSAAQVFAMEYLKRYKERNHMLYKHRLDTAYQYAGIKGRAIRIVQSLGLDSMSSDESDHEGHNGEATYYDLDQGWLSERYNLSDRQVSCTPRKMWRNPLWDCRLSGPTHQRCFGNVALGTLLGATNPMSIVSFVLPIMKGIETRHPVALSHDSSLPLNIIFVPPNSTFHCCLPHDALLLIFGHMVGMKDSTVLKVPSQVCRKWWAVVLEDPLLW
ncbi:hypothetical protein EDD15DRAFT_2198405 [Pisolithus albus]|nr:hypothetical protein EDD15DRAFT_2198405 [Pisolithus albus]